MHWRHIYDLTHFSFLITVMTRPKYEPQVTNIYMATEQGFTFYGSEDTLAHFLSKENDLVWSPCFFKFDFIMIHCIQISKIIVNNFVTCLDLDQCLMNLKTNKKAAVAVSRHHADNNPVIGSTQMFCFPKKDNIYTYSVSMLTKKQYHLLGKIDALVRRISESGLLQKWELESSNSVVESVDAAGPHDNAIKLKIEHVQGGFLLLGVGLAVAAVTFVLEWMYYLLGMGPWPVHYFYVQFGKWFCWGEHDAQLEYGVKHQRAKYVIQLKYYFL